MAKQKSDFHLQTALSCAYYVCELSKDISKASLSLLYQAINNLEL